MRLGYAEQEIFKQVRCGNWQKRDQPPQSSTRCALRRSTFPQEAITYQSNAVGKMSKTRPMASRESRLLSSILFLTEKAKTKSKMRGLPTYSSHRDRRDKTEINASHFVALTTSSMLYSRYGMALRSSCHSSRFGGRVLFLRSSIIDRRPSRGTSAYSWSEREEVETDKQVVSTEA
jgi:hypothetical protein